MTTASVHSAALAVAALLPLVSSVHHLYRRSPPPIEIHHRKKSWRRVKTKFWRGGRGKESEERREALPSLSLLASSCALLFFTGAALETVAGCLIFLMCRYRLLLCDCVLLFQHLWQLFALHITCAHLCVSCEAGSSVVSCFPHRCCSLLAPNHISSTDAWLQKSE